MLHNHFFTVSYTLITNGVIQYTQSYPALRFTGRWIGHLLLGRSEDVNALIYVNLETAGDKSFEWIKEPVVSRVLRGSQVNSYRHLLQAEWDCHTGFHHSIELLVVFIHPFGPQRLQISLSTYCTLLCTVYQRRMVHPETIKEVKLNSFVFTNRIRWRKRENFRFLRSVLQILWVPVQRGATKGSPSIANMVDTINILPSIAKWSQKHRRKFLRLKKSKRSELPTHPDGTSLDGSLRLLSKLKTIINNHNQSNKVSVQLVDCLWSGNLPVYNEKHVERAV